jgi:hypothetical protein
MRFNRKLRTSPVTLINQEIQISQENQTILTSLISQVRTKAIADTI